MIMDFWSNSDQNSEIIHSRQPYPTADMFRTWAGLSAVRESGRSREDAPNGRGHSFMI